MSRSDRVSVNLLRFWGRPVPLTLIVTLIAVWVGILVFHSLDVAAVGEALLAGRRGLGSGLPRLLGLHEDDALLLVCFLLSLHDIGKFARKFQAKMPDVYPDCFGDDPAEPSAYYDHGAGGLRLCSPPATPKTQCRPVGARPRRAARSAAEQASQSVACQNGSEEPNSRASPGTPQRWHVRALMSSAKCSSADKRERAADTGRARRLRTRCPNSIVAPSTTHEHDHAPRKCLARLATGFLRAPTEGRYTSHNGRHRELVRHRFARHVDSTNRTGG